MPILLGLASAASYGAADYFGGVATRRGPVEPVVVGSQAVSLVLGVLIFAVIGAEPDLTGADVALSAGAGLVGLVGLVLLYRGLAIGRMGLVGPLSALVVTAVPVVWGVATGDDVTAAGAAGIGLAVVAVLLVTRERSDPEGGGTSVLAPVLHAVGAGAAFGFVFVLFGETSEGSGYWPLVVARLVTVTLFGAVLLAVRRPVRPGAGLGWMVAATGVCDILGNAFFLAGAREEAISIIAPVTSLYPAGTVLLARVFLGETMERHQVVGFLVALPALVLLSLG